MKLLLFIVLGSLALTGCYATKGEVQKVDLKVDKYVAKNEKRWDAQAAYDEGEEDRILKGIQGRMDPSMRDQFGGGPERHGPSSIGGMPVVRRNSDPRESRQQWTKVWDTVEGRWVVRELDVYAEGPSSYPSAAPPPVAPAQPAATPAPPVAAAPPAAAPAPSGTSAPVGLIGSIADLRLHLQAVTGLARDFKELQELFGGGQANQFVAVNQRLDHMSGQMSLISAGQQRELEEIQKLREEYQRMIRETQAVGNDFRSLKVLGETHIDNLRRLQYEVTIIDAPPPVVVEYRYVWPSIGYYNSQPCRYTFGYTPGTRRRIFCWRYR